MCLLLEKIQLPCLCDNNFRSLNAPEVLAGGQLVSNLWLLLNFRGIEWMGRIITCQMGIGSLEPVRKASKYETGPFEIHDNDKFVEKPP